ncbi:hypothetical protein TWF718_007966 [Orbilia javanica]|uniref:Uncharacterized protein n=1 Tax=Orbilia javanica TaxID=47235 RepID=A0AAN8MW54_9PEZI
MGERERGRERDGGRDDDAGDDSDYNDNDDDGDDGRREDDDDDDDDGDGDGDGEEDDGREGTGEIVTALVHRVRRATERSMAWHGNGIVDSVDRKDGWQSDQHSAEFGLRNHSRKQRRNG